jgi:large subunit ribosomal protein L10
VKKTDKQKIVEELHEKAGKAQFAVLTDFRGLSVAKLEELRKALREAGVDFQVVKNTLLLRASQDTDLANIKEHFSGPNALVLAYGDPVPAAKALSRFAKENDKLFALKAGVLSGKPVGKDDIRAIAELPSREELLSQLLRALNAVPGGFVQVLAAVPRSMYNVLNALAEQKGQQEAA